jgi:hypothetical protein
MSKNKFPILKISNIEWDKDHDEFEKLPKGLELEWGSEKWNKDEVSEWLSLKFDWVLSSLKIDQVGSWEDSGCCCAGGCSCC